MRACRHIETANPPEDRVRTTAGRRGIAHPDLPDLTIDLGALWR
jgi:hypothetical protein